MKKILCLLAVTLIFACIPPLRAAAPAAPSMEVTDNPSLLVSADVKVAELLVYGVKLGDAPEKIPNRAATFERVPESDPDISYWVGKDVAYLAYKGKIIQIVVGGDFIHSLPPFDTTRLQVTLGKADVIEPQADQIYLSFLARQMRIAVIETHTLKSHVVSVTLYAQ